MRLMVVELFVRFVCFGIFSHQPLHKKTRSNQKLAQDHERLREVEFFSGNAFIGEIQQDAIVLHSVVLERSKTQMKPE